MLSRQRTTDTVSDALGEHVWPLVDRLVGNADCLGDGGDGAAKQFNGFGFEHATLNHSSDKDATIVTRNPWTISTMVEYKDRLAKAMKDATVSPTALANELKVSYQAVKKVLTGGTAAFTAFNNSKAASFLGVNSDWLATGQEFTQQPRVKEERATYQVMSASEALKVLSKAIMSLDIDGRERASQLLQSLARDPEGPWEEWLISILSKNELRPIPISDKGKPQNTHVSAERSMETNAPIKNRDLDPALRDNMVPGIGLGDEQPNGSEHVEERKAGKRL